MLCPTRLVDATENSKARGGRSVQLPDPFMTLHSSSRHLCTDTYVLYVRPNTVSGKKAKKAPSEVRSRDGHVRRTCVQNLRVYLLDTAWTSSLVRKTCALYVVACDYLVSV